MSPKTPITHFAEPLEPRAFVGGGAQQSHAAVRQPNVRRVRDGEAEPVWKAGGSGDEEAKCFEIGLRQKCMKRRRETVDEEMKMTCEAEPMLRKMLRAAQTQRNEHT